MHTKQENVYTNIINWNANINANANANAKAEQAASEAKETNEIWKQQIMYTDKKRARAEKPTSTTNTNTIKNTQSEKSEKETDRLSIFIQPIDWSKVKIGMKNQETERKRATSTHREICIHTNDKERERKRDRKLKITTALFQLSNDSSERNGANEEEEEEAEYTEKSELCAQHTTMKVMWRRGIAIVLRRKRALTHTNVLMLFPSSSTMLKSSTAK